MTSVRRVVKIGGSLLRRDTPASDLQAWLDKQDAESTALIVGGGELVEVLRRLDAKHLLGDATAHWLAIDLMAINAHVVADWLGVDVVDGPLVELDKQVESYRGSVVFNPRRFLREEEPSLPGKRLPIGWETTSDSIAARVATAVGAELTLLKSFPPPTDVASDDWRALAARGYVDASFPSLAEGVASISIESISGLPPSASSV